VRLAGSTVLVEKAPQNTRQLQALIRRRLSTGKSARSAIPVATIAKAILRQLHARDAHE
jgi:hypothetical protein